MKILLIQQKMIGDVLVSSLLCEHLKNHLPNAIVHYLINEPTTAVVENNPFIDKIVIFKNEDGHDKRRFYKFLKAIRRERYDVVIDVYGKIESNLITAFSKAKIRIAYKKWYSSFLYTHLVPIKTRQPGGGDLTTIDDRLGLLGPLDLGALNTESKPKIYLNDKEIEDARTFLNEKGIAPNGRLIMLGLLGSSVTKTYPIRYMANVIDRIAENTDALFLLNYIPSQAPQIQEIYDLCSEEARKRIQLNAFAPDLRKFLALLSLCSCYIGNEGGATNMAKALEIPTFSIFAPWIDKKGWHTYANADNQVVHVADYLENLLSPMSKKEIKKQTKRLYELFEPTLFERKLVNFLKTRVFPNQ
ncbi:MAG: glycosyltransferase family 9 protein [Maribacter sp.]|nr:glycosyltransferase family 9 protein [Maribacter sp.]